MNFAVREKSGLQDVGGGQLLGGLFEGDERVPLAVTRAMDQAIHKSRFRGAEVGESKNTGGIMADGNSAMFHKGRNRVD